MTVDTFLITSRSILSYHRTFLPVIKTALMFLFFSTLIAPESSYLVICMSHNIYTSRSPWFKLWNLFEKFKVFISLYNECFNWSPMIIFMCYCMSGHALHWYTVVLCCFFNINTMDNSLSYEGAKTFFTHLTHRLVQFLPIHTHLLSTELQKVLTLFPQHFDWRHLTE